MSCTDSASLKLEDVARQIRERHLEVVSTSGGHLGPGLGVVELTLPSIRPSISTTIV